MSTTYSYTIPTVDGTQVKYYTATSNNEKIGVLSTSSNGFSIVNVPAGTSNYVLNYNGTSSTLSFIAQTEVSTDTDVPKIETVSGALYIQNNGGVKTWQKFGAGILVSNLDTSTVTGVTASDNGDYVIKYQNGTYSLTTYTAVNIHFPSGILVGQNSNAPVSITASKTGKFVIQYDGADYSLVENTSPIYSNGILVGDGSSTLKYMTGQEDDFSSTESNYYIIKATTTNTNTAPSTYSLSVVPLNGLLYTNSEGINSVNISKNGNYVLNYSNNSLSAVTLPTTNNGIITYNANTSTYGCINAGSGTFYLYGQPGPNGYNFVLKEAYITTYNGIIYSADGADYVQDIMRFQEIEEKTSSACYIMHASYDSNRDNVLALNAQIINPGIMYGTDDHDINYVSLPSDFNPNEQYVIKYDSNEASLHLSSFTATASVSVPTSGILVGSANNVIGSIKSSTNVNDTFVINFSSGTTGVDDGTYSLKSLNTLLPTITTSFGSPFLFNLAGSPQTAVYVTLTDTNYYCSTKVSIPTYALKTNFVQTRVDVEGIYRVNFDPTLLELTVDNSFSSSLTIPNTNSVNLMFILAFNPLNVHFGGSTSDNTLANIGTWDQNVANADNDGFNFNTYLNTSHSSIYLTDGSGITTSSQLSSTRNISVIPITNSPPFEYRYFKTSLYFSVNNLTTCDNVNSGTPTVYIMYGYDERNSIFNDGVSIANVNITVYSSAIPSLPVP